MNVLITGAMGWLGIALTKTLATRHHVRTFDVKHSENPREPLDTKVDEVWGSITDFQGVRAAIKGQDAAIHAVMASTRRGLYSPGDVAPFEVNIMGTYNLLEAARQEGLKRVILISSAETHVDHQPGTFVSGNTPYAGTGSIYDMTKRLQESMASWFTEIHNLSVIALRLGDIVDVNLGRCKYGEATFDEAVARDGYIDRFDVGRACVSALEVEFHGFEVLHLVGSPDAKRIFDTARTEAILNIEFTTEFDRRSASNRQ